ncbi:hypothetical protein RCO27_17110 [Sphingosinicella sp. LHD-64]|uniref:hypothetical protein n=1 Tax=Sphingosinicella sp. LHD-64 TaxID=3072139 RepID=UPI0028106BB6|nr:hypothetical protein [Sphingosinicella sp. LHD-64]MDQ8757947.1 hypothetical protein [Sphingosinicella sp. LHD-64]
MPRGNEMRPDWGVDPDVDEDFPDDETIERELRDYRRESTRRNIRSLVVGVIGTSLLAWFFLSMHFQRMELVRLVRSGGGEVRYMAGDTSCKNTPRRGWRGTIGSAAVGTQVDVVARERGWALIDLYGNPCWVPEWSLGPTRPDLPAIYRCGRECHARAPEGWDEEQERLACTRNVLSRLGCSLDSLVRRTGAAG